MSENLGKLNLTNGKMYSYLKEIYQNDKDKYMNFLSMLVQKRTIPVEPEQTKLNDEGYYVGTDTFKCDEDPDTLEKLKKNNWVQDGKVVQIEYKINKHGCRSKNFSEIKDKEIIIGIGCSITFGTGLHQHQTWIHQLADKMDCEYINLSVPGCSTNISSLYCTEYLLEEFKKVKGVFLLIPPPNRLDLLTFTDIQEAEKPLEDQDVSLQPFFKNKYLDNWRDENLTRDLLNHICSLEHTSFLNYHKDEALLKYRCNSLNIHFGSLDSNNRWIDPAYTKARDLSHDGPEYHHDIANEFFRLYNEDK